ncbi:ABC transporter ATP-binding protein [Echinimonas agarilytica]|uniref:ATP-binding cassette domain-containing protein n=1 Tax=Echinimonas agarilytica TaxID=1215918 RepID=A0AA42B7J4_9GAMM|nr:ATP-binding cassette domain-containing protein [Echinimonas agarilytica]MCM2680185.1 ATP-binding cassette domain-containing protein [Echinimonas agarilytica]
MLKVQGLQKFFKVSGKAKHQDARRRGKQFWALESLSFEAETGEVIGLLGANGAGKTTTLRLLTGILSESDGSIEYNNQSIGADPLAYRRQLGFLSGSKGLYDRLSVIENLQFFGRMYGLNAQNIAQRIDSLAQQLDLTEFLDRKVSELSTGMRQRAAIARALVHDPKLVVFDEPTTGLDIVATERVLQCVEALKSDGKTILFATHHMDEVELLCDRILVIDKGKRLYFGDVERFKTDYQATSLNAALRDCLQSGGAL